MNKFNFHDDRRMITALFSKLSEKPEAEGKQYHLRMAVPYITWPNFMKKLWFRKNYAKIDFMTSSPQANGYWDAHKVKYLFPFCYLRHFAEMLF